MRLQSINAPLGWFQKPQIVYYSHNNQFKWDSMLSDCTKTQMKNTARILMSLKILPSLLSIFSAKKHQHKHTILLLRTALCTVMTKQNAVVDCSINVDPAARQR